MQACEVICYFSSNIRIQILFVVVKTVYFCKSFLMRRSFYLLQRRLDFIMIKELERFFRIAKAFRDAFNLKSSNDSYIYRNQYLLVVRLFIMIQRHKGSYILFDLLLRLHELCTACSPDTIKISS